MFDLGLTVLVVDDMRTMRKIVMKNLKEIGFSTFVEAEDGIKAWEAVSSGEHGIGLIISDWNMPNCSGLDFLKRVRADSRYQGLPFVLLTAESEVEQVKEALQAGVDSYIVKPFSKDILEAKLTETYKKRNL